LESLNSFKSNVFRINNQNFDVHALNLFRFQYHNNPVYKAFVDHLEVNPNTIQSVGSIPFMPIRFFKEHKIISGRFAPQHVFESSGTTMSSTSKHYIEDLQYYTDISTTIFSQFFGNLRQSVVIGLLPSYLERQTSSLVYMVDQFIKITRHPASGFYLDNYPELIATLSGLKNQELSVYLFGVTFALLELSRNFKVEMKNLVVFETGGMKGRGREMVREELHDYLAGAFTGGRISSEYGMTELLSQAYLGKSGYFHCPPWMQVFIRDVNDPFYYMKNGKTGVINVIDLANVHSCAFIETEDLGIKTSEGFRVLGRLDNSDMRGCNLLIT
jgi:phenylacetate-coenzyme A ligase PaaK-like adenylate-forming protein